MKSQAINDFAKFIIKDYFSLTYFSQTSISIEPGVEVEVTIADA